MKLQVPVPASVRQIAGTQYHQISLPHTDGAEGRDAALGSACSGPALWVTAVHLGVQGFQPWEQSRAQLQIPMLNNHLLFAV